jgi:ribosomal protein L16 Arg81 hydroxylase
MMDYDDEYTPQVTGHETETGYAFSVNVKPPTQEEIADALARRMMHDYTSSTSLTNAVADRFYALVRETVDAAAMAAISDAMLAPRQRTDEFGNPVGEAVSFQQMIAAQVKAWQDETVSTYDGKPKKKDHYSDDVVTRAEYLVRMVGASDFAKLAKAEVALVKTQASTLVTNTIKNTVAEALKALAK